MLGMLVNILWSSIHVRKLKNFVPVVLALFAREEQNRRCLSLNAQPVHIFQHAAQIIGLCGAATRSLRNPTYPKTFFIQEFHDFGGQRIQGAKRRVVNNLLETQTNNRSECSEFRAIDSMEIES